jgi:hypothetical protein
MNYQYHTNLIQQDTVLVAFSKKNHESRDMVNLLIHKFRTVFYLVCNAIKKARSYGFFLTLILSVPREFVVFICYNKMKNDNVMLAFLKCFYDKMINRITTFYFQDGFGLDADLSRK